MQSKDQLKIKNSGGPPVIQLLNQTKIVIQNHLGDGPVIRAWDQEICSLYDLRFEPCGCSYDSHWRLTWSLISGSVELVEVRASWPEHHHEIKKKIVIQKCLKMWLGMQLEKRITCVNP